MRRCRWADVNDGFKFVGMLICRISAEQTNFDMTYDAILVVSFGGPESKEDVMPFLENVLRGRNVPRGRMLTVAEHYYHFEGKSPINQQTRELIAAVQSEMDRNGLKLPVYWGNRNWHPLLPETLEKMNQDGIRRAVAFVTSAYSSYSGCRQYREDIARGQRKVGPGAPEVDKLRAFFNHPGFIEATVERVRDALEAVPNTARENVLIVYTAHSVPESMANTSDYVKQLEEVRRLVSGAIGHENDVLVYQSRSGGPGQPWLGPDILEYVRQVKAENKVSAVVIAPISFISDHMEVLYDLDIEAQQLCDALGLPMTRAKTVGVHPKFIAMIRELILERMNPATERRALGVLGPRPDVCAEDCCPAPQQRPVRPHAS
ncbi:MAG TPA: ferrochelatase [Candidatus Sulfotelmatobacter sp.]|nr:ferrochelatase [Candidatus Sulfotelmatobacter sp.]